MDYRKPLVISFGDTAGTQNGRHYISVNDSWANVKSNIGKTLTNDDCDYILVVYGKNSKNNNLNKLNMATNELRRQADLYQKPLVTYYDDNVYQLNPKYTADGRFVVSDKVVEDKYHKYGSQETWQKHQSEVWSKMETLYTLSSSDKWKGAQDHKGKLTNPSRGLEEKDLDGFFSLRSSLVMSPSLLDDDLIGMPGFSAYKSEDRFFNGEVPVGNAPITIRSAMNGYTIPMRNIHGDMAKFQIGSDISAFNSTLKARAVDGVSVKTSDYYDKSKKTYLFKLSDGRDSKLKITNATDNIVTFNDVNGEFTAPTGSDIKALLQSRNYVIPDLIDNLKPIPKSKYSWPTPGSMISDGTKDLVSPSVAGFIPTREPKNGANDYVVMIVEGALKGHIAAKYLKDSPVADAVCGDRGLIIAQVPGVAKSFLHSVSPVYSEYKVSETVVAMDADGRYNLRVAEGIHDAEHIFSTYGKTTIMSWNPEQKGIDDALLALHRNEITMSDFGLKLGTANDLFPKSEAVPPTPHSLYGDKPSDVSEWLSEYRESLQESKIVRQKLQENNPFDNSNDTVNDTKQETVDTSTMSLSDKAKLVTDKSHITQSDIVEFAELIESIAERFNNQLDNMLNR